MEVGLTSEAREWIQAKGGSAVVDLVACST